VESFFLNRDQGLGLWSGRTDSKTLDYQRTNPRDYQIVRSHMQKKHLNTRPNHHPTTSSTLCRTPYLSKQQTKQKYKPNYQQTGLPLHSALPIKGKVNKNSAQISPYTKLTQTTGPSLGGQKPKGRKNSILFKERIQLSLKPGKRRSQTIS